MKTEFYLPLYYSLKRYMIRHDTSLKSSITGFFSSLLRDYVWIPVYAILLLNGPNNYQIAGILLHLIVFSIIYEMGYIYTDNISVLKEDVKIRKVIYKEPQPSLHIYISLAIRFFVAVVLMFFMQRWLNVWIVLLYVSLLMIYFVYGNLNERWRIPFFVALRFLKGFLPYAFLLITLIKVQLMLVVLLLFATTVFFSVEYMSRKLQISYINIQELKYTWLRYLLIFLIVSPYILLNKIPLREFSLLFTIYVGVNVLMIIASIARKLISGENLVKIIKE